MSQPLLLVGGLVLAIGLAAGYVIRLLVAIRWSASLENKAKTEVLNAQNIAQDIVLQAKNKAVALLDEAKKEEKERKIGLDRAEDRLIKKEEYLVAREQEVKAGEQQVQEDIKKVRGIRDEMQRAKDSVQGELSRIAQMSPEEAQRRLIAEIQEKHKADLVSLLQKQSQEREDVTEKKAVEMMTMAMQRYARTHISDITTTVFNLPSEDLKGKIIGREGRNIKTLERLAGVELIVDETPETIIISSFDPYRREIARLALERLVKDGRIQPAKIEEVVEEVKVDIEKRMYKIGEDAAFEAGIVDLPKEIIYLLGRLHFRTSFGQNVLTHSIEMAHIAGMIATELGLNVEITKKGALLHDIGKAIDHEVQGTHVELGRKILKKYGVSEEVIRAMESHHDEYPFSSSEAYLVAAADVISAARPGARRGTVENYIKRLADLERIACSFDGVKQAYAVSAGREIRVFVVPEKVDDFRALQLARDIAAKISSDLQYPGEIKVNVIREIRAVEYAR